MEDNGERCIFDSSLRQQMHTQNPYDTMVQCNNERRAVEMVENGTVSLSYDRKKP